MPTKKELREDLREAKKFYEATGFDAEDIKLLQEMIAEPRRKPSAPKLVLNEIERLAMIIVVKNFKKRRRRKKAA